MKKILFSFLLFSLVIISGAIIGYSLGYRNDYESGEWDGKYNSFDEIWTSGYADGYVWGFQEAIIWPIELNHDTYIWYYNQSVWNWENGTSAEDYFNELVIKHNERRDNYGGC